MKKQLLTILSIATAASAFAQLPVSTTPQNRKVVLQEFTGVYCGYCPDGHVRAENLKSANPGNVVLINIHSGSFANVNTGQPDLKTSVGNAIDPMTGMNILGYPAGDINRTNFGSTLTPSYAQQTVSPWGMAQSRGTWSATATNSILNQSSYVNVALQGSVDVTTRVLTVQVEVYYTANSPVATNSLNVFLLENKVIGPQTNYGNPYWNLSNYNQDGTYNHNHVLRASLTNNFGITIPTTTMGTTYTTTLTYTVPATYGAAGKTNPSLLGNLELVAFVTETDRPTISGASGPIILTGFTNTLDIAPNNLITPNSVCGGQNFASSFKFSNNGGNAVTSAVFSYSMNGAAIGTYTFSGNVNPMTSSPTLTLPLFNFSPNPSNNFSIEVVSVNGSTDQNNTNNLVGSAAIPLTSLTAPIQNMTMEFTQDRYGSESTWSVVDELTNASMASGGPYTNLPANGTSLHAVPFIVYANNCYKLVVNDSYGDGINAGYGAGGYVLKSGGSAIITSNGQYGKGDTKLYKSGLFTGVSTAVQNISGVAVYPNPTAGAANMNVVMAQNESVNITVINSLGQEVYSSQNNFNAGENTVAFDTQNWAAGVYFINVATDKGSLKQKLTVTK